MGVVVGRLRSCAERLPSEGSQIVQRQTSKVQWLASGLCGAPRKPPGVPQGSLQCCLPVAGWSRTASRQPLWRVEDAVGPHVAPPSEGVPSVVWLVDALDKGATPCDWARFCACSRSHARSRCACDCSSNGSFLTASTEGFPEPAGVGSGLDAGKAPICPDDLGFKTEASWQCVKADQVGRSWSERTSAGPSYDLGHWVRFARSYEELAGCSGASALGFLVAVAAVVARYWSSVHLGVWLFCRSLAWSSSRPSLVSSSHCPCSARLSPCWRRVVRARTC